MGKFQIAPLADAAAELEDLLRYNGFAYRREGDWFYLVFSERGFKWETLCRCQDQVVLIYGRYPFPVLNEERLRKTCEEINRQVIFGSMFLSEGQAVFRTAADLFDPYSAYEHIGRALEYNAGVMVRFWTEVAAVAL